MQLHELGWNDTLASQFEQYREQKMIPLRIARENREQYIALAEGGIQYNCAVTGKFRYTHSEASEYPAVGDWVSAVKVDDKQAQIHVVLDRKSAFSRKVPGVVTEEQIVAANIDTLFIVTGLDDNFKVRRIERYVSLAWDSGAVPVLLLNKVDLCDDIASRLSEVEEVASGAEILIGSALTGIGVDEIQHHIRPGKTVAFVGSSGVGKSTIINALLGYEKQEVSHISEVNFKGRHTTTHRELIVLPSGGMVIDTPGMREIQVWGDEEGLKQAFDDIETLAESCRFSDCTHITEPGCAVKQALETGELTEERFAAYLKLRKEFEHLARRQSIKAMQEERAKWKSIAKMGKTVIKLKRGER